MKILSWNLYNFFDAEYFVKQAMIESLVKSEEYVQSRVSFFAETIKRESPDIVYFLEVGSESLLKELAESVFGNNVYIFKTRGDRRGIFNACISKTQLNCEEIFIDNLEIPLFVVGEPSITDRFLVQKRSFIKTTINRNKIYCVHLKAQLPSTLKRANGDDYEPQNSVEASRAHVVGELTGMAEAYALRKMFSEDINAGNQVMMLGDFNSDTPSRRMNILRGKMLMGRESHDEMFDVFPVNDSQYYSYIWQNNHVRIDHVLVSNHLLSRIKEKKMLSEYIGNAAENTWHDVSVIGSDHAPVIIDVDLL